MKKSKIIITFFIVLLSFLIRVIRLDVPHEWSFDEVYHALSAEAYALNDPRGYEWWNPSPKDLAYEWLHPPLGKLFMAASIKLFSKPYIPESKEAPLEGHTTFAWRFPGTIFAALTVWLLIRFGEKLFKNYWIGAVAGGLYGLDGLSFVQSRTGMNDIYVTFFVVLAFYRLFIFIIEYAGPAAGFPPEKTLKRGTLFWGSPFPRHPLQLFDFKRHPQFINYKNLFLLGLATGLAASTKWTGFYIVGIVLVWGVSLLFKKRNWKMIPLTLLTLVIIPIMVYFLSYSQWWIQGHTWKQFVELHQQIWWYQTGLKATHDYQSPALSWPILYRPVWFYVKYQDVVKEGVKTLYIGNIYTMGHPFIWWAGLTGIVYALLKVLYNILRKMRSQKIKIPSSNFFALKLLLVGYFGMFLPWVASPRIMFMYHYLPSVPFMCLILAYVLDQIRRLGKLGKYGVIGYISLVIVGFIYFYPHWSALPLPQSWVNYYFWLPSWK